MSAAGLLESIFAEMMAKRSGSLHLAMLRRLHSRDAASVSAEFAAEVEARQVEG
jgi:hypothetical protein